MVVSKGVDYAWGKPGGRAIKAAGFDFVCRYLSLNPQKDINLTEAQDLHANQLKIVLVWETTEQRALLGPDAGVIDAKRASELAMEVGCPKDRPIYFAADFDFNEKQQPQIEEYFKGIGTVLPVSRIGVYGGLLTLQNLLNKSLVSFAWQTMAWSKGKWDARVNIEQVKFDQVINKVVCDFNQAITQDYGQW